MFNPIKWLWNWIKRMFQVTPLNGFGAGQSGGKRSFYAMLQEARATSSLNFCFDPASSSSYSGSGQDLTDLSGGGNSAYLGLTGSATSTDPTFNGSAGGLSSSEYFSFDGLDCFNMQSATPTYMYPWGKTGATYSVIAWVYVPSAQDNAVAVLSTIGNVASFFRGVRCQISVASKRPFITYGQTTAAVNISPTETNVLTLDRWQMVSYSVAEGTGTSFVAVNGTICAISSDTYSSPMDSDPTLGCRLFSSPGSSTTDQTGTSLSFDSGGRSGPIAGFSRALSQSEIRTIFQLSRERYGV